MGSLAMLGLGSRSLSSPEEREGVPEPLSGAIVWTKVHRTHTFVVEEGGGGGRSCSSTRSSYLHGHHDGCRGCCGPRAEFASGVERQASGTRLFCLRPTSPLIGLQYSSRRLEILDTPVLAVAPSRWRPMGANIRRGRMEERHLIQHTFFLPDGG